MKYYVYGKRSKVYYGVAVSYEKAKEWLDRAKIAYPFEEWEIVKA